MDPNDPNRPNPGTDPGRPNSPNDAGQNPPNQGGTQRSGRLGESTIQAERRYSLSISEEDRKKAFAMEDERWSTANQIKDWLKLLLMVAITAVWCLIVYFMMPVLR